MLRVAALQFKHRVTVPPASHMGHDGRGRLYNYFRNHTTRLTVQHSPLSAILDYNPGRFNSPHMGLAESQSDAASVREPVIFTEGGRPNNGFTAQSLRSVNGG